MTVLWYLWFGGALGLGAGCALGILGMCALVQASAAEEQKLGRFVAVFVVVAFLAGGILGWKGGAEAQMWHCAEAIKDASARIRESRP